MPPSKAKPGQTKKRKIQHEEGEPPPEAGDNEIVAPLQTEEDDEESKYVNMSTWAVEHRKTTRLLWQQTPVVRVDDILAASDTILRDKDDWTSAADRPDSMQQLDVQIVNWVDCPPQQNEMLYLCKVSVRF
ncbi:hypothetical protein OIO90_006144 [Microbotryomycetes sp. JL221]|nr:hypothetical protein OIO90_006144 [Microbotryomycetes sp. JL221]